MDRIWQWAWDRYGARYSWVVYGITFALLLPTYLLWSWVVVTNEKSGQYGEAIVITVAGVLVLVYVLVLPGLGFIALWISWPPAHRSITLEASETDGLGATKRGSSFSLSQGDTSYSRKYPQVEVLDV
jgi:adenylate cyclase